MISYIVIDSKMPLSAAERQRRRRQRIRDDPARELAEREKDRKRWHQRKAAGSVKLVGELSERDVRIRRRYWREDKRKKQVEKQRQNANTTPTTPPICLPRRRNARRNNQRRIKLKMAKLQERLNEERRKSEMYRKRWRRAMPQAFPFDVIAVSETWLKDNDTNSSYSIDVIVVFNAQD